MAIMMLVMSFFVGIRHPHVPDEGTPLDTNRKRGWSEMRPFGR